MTSGIAIVGMACRYPDARSPVQLWKNVLAQRRAFRRIPPERLRVEDYLSSNRDNPDSTYSTQAAVIENYEFDRLSFRVAGSTYRVTDLAHWLALDVAAQALADADFPGGEGLPRESTGVLVGNTLTGEFSRANLMRLRWPYVQRVVEGTLLKEGWLPDQCDIFLQKLETAYKKPFPPVDEETLAGSLSNTIAGRICNYFDFKGAGYTVDGACASSLLAVANVCSAIVAGDLDVGLAGGVDLSLDPLELIGFAKTGALTPDEMRVYDARSAGFLPGEGCGFIVLMRHEDAIKQSRRIYAVIRGWGISSDGSGGITRPTVEGQSEALRRAYTRAGFGIESISYFEGHGTGTMVGDATELRALSRALCAAPFQDRAVIGSVKAIIGHTKAAAGIAGLINATMAVYNQILPPIAGHEFPHVELTVDEAPLRTLRVGEVWPPDRPLRASASAMGFGGINVHVVLEGITAARRTVLSPEESVLLHSAQDAELFLLGGGDVNELIRKVEHLLAFVSNLSQADLIDLAAEMQRELDVCHVRGAVVASNPSELNYQLETLKSWLINKPAIELDVSTGVFLGVGIKPLRIGFLFPGQGSPAYLDGGAWSRRFKAAAQLYERVNLPARGDNIATAIAQPAIVTASVAALSVLKDLGLSGDVAVGHSLGELTALHWAGALDEETALNIATARGRFMQELKGPAGVMATIGAGPEQVEELLDGELVVIACLNSPTQTVISGMTSAVEAVVARARALGIFAATLPVSHAFHSPLVAEAAPMLAKRLLHEKFSPLRRTVISTVTGARFSPSEDVRHLLYRQITSPVRFKDAIGVAADGLDLLIEVGPGEVLTGLTSQFAHFPIVALDAGGPSLRGLLKAVGAAFALSAPINHAALFNDRFTRPFDLNSRPRFFTNPCELAPLPTSKQPHKSDIKLDQATGTNAHNSISALEVVRYIVAKRAEIPLSSVEETHRLLADLHLNSLSVGQIVTEAARSLSLHPPVALTDYAHATVAEIARALDGLSKIGGSNLLDEEQIPFGVDSWVRTFGVALIERPLTDHKTLSGPGHWRIFSSPNNPLKAALVQIFSDFGAGNGVIMCLPPDPDERHICLLLESARHVLERTEVDRFVVVQHAGGGAAFAKTLHLERSGLIVCVVDVPADHPKAPEWVLAEATAAVGYTEAHYDSVGCRREPVLRLLPFKNLLPMEPLGPSDVLLVTGGGKGIAAECALGLARQTGVRLALIGRSQPADDKELSANLDRVRNSGIDFRYITADITHAEAIKTAINDVESELGRVTAILHGAGSNVPQLLTSLDEAAFLRTLAPKLQGARNLLAALDPTYLRNFVAFGSIIARVGMPGEADYALANEWLARSMERLQSQHPTCRFLAVEWSVWSGVGMGERLGRVDSLVREGITPITPDIGVSMMGHLLTKQFPTSSVVVTGRCGKARTLKLDQPELPLLRFLERPRAYYPGVELVVDADISSDTDPYLNDHVFGGEQLFPVVIALEAMAQVAMSLVESSMPPTFEQVVVVRPVVIAEDQSLTIRIAALVGEQNCVEVVIRSAATSFQIDHFQAVCRFEVPTDNFDSAGEHKEKLQLEENDFPPIAFNPKTDLYGNILFHQGRFRRLTNYRVLMATECVAEISPNKTDNWFSHYLPSELLLGDPGSRDAVIHAIQACIPRSTVLPVGVDRLVIAKVSDGGARFVHARERSHEQDTFVYDLVVTNATGVVEEYWQGLRLQTVGQSVYQGPWVESLLGPYIQRCISEFFPGSMAKVVMERDVTNGRRSRSDRAIQRAVGERVPVQRRPDGKPEVKGDVWVSVSHCGDLTLAVAGPEEVIACDVESVIPRAAAIWQDLLGVDRIHLVANIEQEVGEEHNASATRVWAAMECLKKAGALIDCPLILVSAHGDGWVLLSAGSLVIATFSTEVREVQNHIAVAVLLARRGLSSLEPSVHMIQAPIQHSSVMVGNRNQAHRAKRQAQ